MPELTIKDGENLALQMFRAFYELSTNPKQKAFFKWELDNFTQRNVESKTEAEWEIIRNAVDFTPKIKNCFYNSQSIVLSHPKIFKYFEGFVYDENVPIPIEHAWLEINRKVFDPTFELALKRDITKGYVYTGIEVDVTDIWKLWTKYNESMSVLSMIVAPRLLK
jgi:hypothetical protein